MSELEPEPEPREPRDVDEPKAGELCRRLLPTSKARHQFSWPDFAGPGTQFVCAPMVLQSECAFRMLVRQYGCGVCWAPMAKALHAWPTTYSPDVIADLRQARDRDDRPLVAQLGGTGCAELLSAARAVQPHCDAVDLNLGCPQRTAQEDGFGAFLMDDPETVRNLISTLARELDVPVFAKCRVFSSLQRTLEFVRMLEQSGCSLITVHGRTRDNTTHNGPCDWSAIRACVDAVGIPVIANGAVHSADDARRCLEETGAVAVMGATGLLHDPRMFSRTAVGSAPREPFALAREYLRFVAQYPIASAYGIRNVRDHMRRMLRSEIMQGGPMFGSMFETNTRVQHREQFCALVSALAATLGLEGPPRARLQNVHCSNQKPSLPEADEQHLLSMKQIKTWPEETASVFECRCGSCHA